MQAYPIAWAQGQGQTTHCQNQKKKKKVYNTKQKFGSHRKMYKIQLKVK